MNKVHVTAIDIANGVKHEPFTCPVALALKRMTGKRWFVLYNIATFTGVSEEHDSEIALPKKVAIFIEQFDKGKEVKPFTFSYTVVY